MPTGKSKTQPWTLEATTYVIIMAGTPGNFHKQCVCRCLHCRVLAGGTRHFQASQPAPVSTHQAGTMYLSESTVRTRTVPWLANPLRARSQESGSRRPEARMKTEQGPAMPPSLGSCQACLLRSALSPSVRPCKAVLLSAERSCSALDFTFDDGTVLRYFCINRGTLHLAQVARISSQLLRRRRRAPNRARCGGKAVAPPPGMFWQEGFPPS